MAVLWTLVIMVLCWIPGSVVREIEDDSLWFEIPYFDKLVHGGIFIVFSILWARLGTSRRRFAWIALGGLGLAVITELVQRARRSSAATAVSPTRPFDIAGVLVGIVAAPLVEPLARPSNRGSSGSRLWSCPGKRNDRVARGGRPPVALTRRPGSKR